MVVGVIDATEYYMPLMFEKLLTIGAIIPGTLRVWEQEQAPPQRDMAKHVVEETFAKIGAQQT